jgi:hypothetical protein
MNDQKREPDPNLFYTARQSNVPNVNITVTINNIIYSNRETEIRNLSNASFSLKAEYHLYLITRKLRIIDAHLRKI